MKLNTIVDKASIKKPKRVGEVLDLAQVKLLGQGTKDKSLDQE